MSDPVLGLGPNLNAYRAALQARPQSQQMQQVARLVASTLASAFRDVPFPVEAPRTQRERRLLALRAEVARLVEELEDVVREGGVEEAAWSEAPADHTTVTRRRAPRLARAGAGAARGHHGLSRSGQRRHGGGAARPRQAARRRGGGVVGAAR